MNPILENRVVLSAWKFIQSQLKRDLVKFEEVKGKRSDAGKESARLRALNKEQQNPTKATSVESVQQTSTNPTDNDNDNDNVINKVDFKGLMDLYSNQIGESGSDIWRESVYRKHKIKQGNLRELVDHFIIHLGTQTGGEYNEPFNKFRTYCSNWIGTEIVAGRLAKFRTVKQIGSI